MVSDVHHSFPDIDDLAAGLRNRVRPGAQVLDVRALTLGLFAHDQYSNLLMVGVGFQLGGLPLPAAAVEEAIRLNGVAVDRNLQAFRYGRMWVLDPARVTRAATAATPATAGATALDARWVGPGLERLVTHRSAELVAYQDEAYAEHFRRAVENVRVAEEAALPGSTVLAEHAARNLFKLMAYKDEYEVARLALDVEVGAQLRAQFGPGARARWNLHPPALRAIGMDRKIQLGPWFRPVFHALYQMRRLRGTRLDPFGRAHVRVVERELVGEYLAVLDELATHLTADNHATAVELAALPDVVRGYEEVKLRNVETYRAGLTQLRARFVSTRVA
jgi:indolepyruvate ferredoxin oxidoreductase